MIRNTNGSVDEDKKCLVILVLKYKTKCEKVLKWHFYSNSKYFTPTNKLKAHLEQDFMTHENSVNFKFQYP